MNDSKSNLDLYNGPVSCVRCYGSLSYKGLGEYVCDVCGAKSYDDYGKVRNYLEEHKGAGVAEIAMMTGVDKNQIRDMLEEERFEIGAQSRVFLKCKGCGIDIRSGRYCQSCAKIAEAARMKKQERLRTEEHQKNMSGVAAMPQHTESGAKRFTRNN